MARTAAAFALSRASSVRSTATVGSPVRVNRGNLPEYAPIGIRAASKTRDNLIFIAAACSMGRNRTFPDRASC